MSLLSLNPKFLNRMNYLMHRLFQEEIQLSFKSKKAEFHWKNGDNYLPLSLIISPKQ